MNLNEILSKLTEGEIPTGTMGGGGLILMILALRGQKVMRTLLILVALALMGGAVWWHFHIKHQAPANRVEVQSSDGQR